MSTDPHLTPPAGLAPIAPVDPAPRRSPAEEARTLVHATNEAALATLSDGGDPWASLVTYGPLPDGAPVLLVSRLAEHGRNLARDPRASVVIDDAAPGDVLGRGRVTLAGRAEAPAGTARDTALAAHCDNVPGADYYAGFGDFTVWVLRVERVRWVGGFGRMNSATAEEYAAAEADPTALAAAGAIEHLNDDHADALLLMAQKLGGHPDATEAICTAIDRHGIDLRVITPRGKGETRVGFAGSVTRPDGLRAATVELTRRARG